jgi:hypothetical protein
MTKQADRPRLEIQTYQPTAPVEFGAAPSLITTIPDVYVNTGCADLVYGTITVDENEINGSNNGLAFTSKKMSVDFMDRAASIADRLARDAFASKYTQPDEMVLGDDAVLTVRENDLERSVNRAAAGFPTFINGIVEPYSGQVLTSGDTMDLVIDVIQANINRGPQCFYMTIESNDPDFFLNNTALPPEQLVCLIGGCLIDTTTLTFGVGGANEALVSNTGRLGTGDWGDGPAGFNCFLIDGDGASYYQGAYVWAVDTFRVAVNTQDWTSGGGEVDAFISLQPDPNWCDNECKPYLDAGVTLGYMTHDGGLTYDPIIGNMVCKNFLDSVQNFDLGLGWDWENFGAPFDAALSFGLYAEGRVMGALDEPSLANLTLEVLEITERNGLAVDDWYMAEIWDCDNGGDSVAIDRDISTAWAFNKPAADQAWGQIKIPFGCGYEPILNNWGFYGQSGTPGFGFWGWGIFWDSAYAWMDRGVGVFGPNVSTGDAEAMATIAKHDFGPSETYEIGVAHFGLLGMTDASSSAEIAPLAKLVNKWAGFDRGDVNNDGAVNLADIVYLAAYVNNPGVAPGPIPFEHLGNVDNIGGVDMNDVLYLITFYFDCGACPVGAFVI